MLKVVYGNDLQLLAAHLATQQHQQPLAPFEAEQIIVQSNELSRWLSLYLAQQQGIAANLAFPFPSAYIWRLFRQIWPAVPLQSPYAKEPLTWRLFALLPACRELPEFAMVDAYLGETEDALRLYGLASRIADTFDQYLMYRPDWIHEWEQGNTTNWQGQLWQRLTADDNAPMHRARLLQQLYDLLQTGHLPKGLLPSRLSIFGISAMPPVYLSVFELMAQYCDITLYYLSPSEQFWGDLLTEKQISKQQLELTLDDGILTETHPLLASFGKQGQEFFQQLQDIEHDAEFAFTAPQTKTMLGQLQAEIFDLDLSATNAPLAVDDHSIKVHTCHSAMREIEVLHDQLLALFAENPELSPSDVVVMTADIDTYAPWIEAVFGTAEKSQRIAFSIADSSGQAESPLLMAWMSILALPQSRFDVESVLALLECPAIQQRFELDDVAVQWCRQWCIETRTRWGMDAQDKADLDLPASIANTWRAGLDRLLLGYAMPLTEADHPWRLFDEQLAFDGINGERARIVASLARFIEQLANWRQRLNRQQTLPDWQQELNLCLDAFFAMEIDDSIAQQELIQSREQLNQLTDSAEQAGFEQKLGIEVVASWLQSHLQAVDTSQKFLGHGVTFCGMVPMRSIPFPVICLIGMNDDMFPRREPTLGFDLLAQHHQRGDRSRRDDDRYLFLEALISAKQQLYISYVGASIADNAEIPPSVLVSDLLDYLDERFVAADGSNASAFITTRHPLQSFSRRYFDGLHRRLFSYKQNQCPDNSVADVQDWLNQLLPEADEDWRTVSLMQLSQFFRHPARFLCRERLNIRLELDDEELIIREPFSLDGLEAWQLRQLLLEDRLKQHVLADSANIIRATGMLPQGQIGDKWLEQEAQKVENFVDILQPQLPTGTATSLSVDIKLDGFTVSGQLNPLSEHGLLHYRLSKTKGSDLIAAWLEHLILNTLRPQNTALQTRLILEDGLYVFKPVTNPDVELKELLALYWQGLHAPLPFFDKSSLAYAQQAVNGKPEKALAAAEKAWFGSEFYNGEKDDPYYRLIYRESPFEQSFTDTALRVYTGLLQHCELVKDLG